MVAHGKMDVRQLRGTAETAALMVDAKVFLRRCLENNKETRVVVARFSTRVNGALAFVRASTTSDALAECIGNVGRQLEVDRHTPANVPVDVALQWTPPP